VASAPDEPHLDLERPSFLESLVARVSIEFGAEPQVVGRLAAEIVTRFANARVQSFIPVLVEKQLRERLRSYARAETA
jgi:hypothetical protein